MYHNPKKLCPAFFDLLKLGRGRDISWQFLGNRGCDDRHYRHDPVEIFASFRQIHLSRRQMIPFEEKHIGDQTPQGSMCVAKSLMILSNFFFIILSNYLCSSYIGRKTLKHIQCTSDRSV